MKYNLLGTSPFKVRQRGDVASFEKSYEKRPETMAFRKAKPEVKQVFEDLGRTTKLPWSEK